MRQRETLSHDLAALAALIHATRSAMADMEFRQALVASGFEPQVDSNFEKARRFVEDEIARWTPIIKAIGLKLE
jgi:tripartite-type tricarboxylate transporter receptor subunit TctC